MKVGMKATLAWYKAEHRGKEVETRTRDRRGDIVWDLCLAAPTRRRIPSKARLAQQPLWRILTDQHGILKELARGGWCFSINYSFSIQGCAGCQRGSPPRKCDAPICNLCFVDLDSDTVFCNPWNHTRVFLSKIIQNYSNLTQRQNRNTTCHCSCSVIKTYQPNVSQSRDVNIMCLAKTSF